MSEAPSLPPLDDATCLAVVAAMAPVLGIEILPEWRESVAAHLKATAGAARLVLSLPLDDNLEPAPVFRP